MSDHVTSSTDAYDPGMSFGTLIKTAFGLIVTAGICAALAIGIATMHFPMTDVRISPALGKHVFNLRCSACHSVASNGKAKMGPGLHNIGEDGASRKPGMTSQQYILESILHPDAFVAPGVSGNMPAGLVDDVPDSAVRSLLAYLMQQGSKVRDFDELLAMQIKRPLVNTDLHRASGVATVRRGERLFNETLGCAACHGLHGDVGEDFLAPSLAHAGILPEDYIRESLQKPGAIISPGYEQAVVTLQDGQVLSGRMWSRNANRMLLLTTGSNGQWDLKEIATDTIKVESGKLAITISPVSVMPPYDLSRAQFADLLAFLRTLKAEPSAL